MRQKQKGPGKSGLTWPSSRLRSAFDLALALGSGSAACSFLISLQHRRTHGRTITLREPSIHVPTVCPHLMFCVCGGMVLAKEPNGPYLIKARLVSRSRRVSSSS